MPTSQPPPQKRPNRRSPLVAKIVRMNRGFTELLEACSGLIEYWSQFPRHADHKCGCYKCVFVRKVEEIAAAQNDD